MAWKVVGKETIITPDGKKEEKPSTDDGSKWLVPNKPTDRKNRPFPIGGMPIGEFRIHEETSSVSDLNILPQDLTMLPTSIQTGKTKWIKQSLNIESWTDVEFYRKSLKWSSQEYYPQSFRWTQNSFYPRGDKWDENATTAVGTARQVPFTVRVGSPFYPQAFRWDPQVFYPQAFRWDETEFYFLPSRWDTDDFYFLPPRWDPTLFYPQSNAWYVPLDGKDLDAIRLTFSPFGRPLD